MLKTYMMEQRIILTVNAWSCVKQALLASIFIQIAIQYLDKIDSFGAVTGTPGADGTYNILASQFLQILGQEFLRI